jgi:hypothetical protein
MVSDTAPAGWATGRSFRIWGIPKEDLKGAASPAQNYLICFGVIFLCTVTINLSSRNQIDVYDRVCTLCAL